MTIERLEAELRDVEQQRSTLQEELDRLRIREEEAHIALRVLRRLTPARATDAALPPVAERPASKRDEEVLPPTQAPAQHRSREEASAAIAAAGPAAIEILQMVGEFIKPMDMVQRLAHDYGILVGLGKKGRETSDLSAAIGHGRVAGLEVTRGRGWGLTEWDGVPPNAPQAQNAEPVNAVERSAGPVEETLEATEVEEK